MSRRRGGEGRRPLRRAYRRGRGGFQFRWTFGSSPIAWIGRPRVRCGRGWLPGGPERAVVSGGEVGLDLWLRRHEREHLRAAAEGGPGHGRRRGVAGAGEVRPGRSHVGRERLLAGGER